MLKLESLKNTHAKTKGFHIVFVATKGKRFEEDLCEFHRVIAYFYI